MQLILLLILPIVMHTVVGGLGSSSYVMTWCIMAPAGCIVYCHKPEAFVSSSESRWWHIRIITEIQHSIRDFRPVMADANVACFIAAYVATILARLQSTPTLQVIAVDLPPLILCQVTERADLETSGLL